MTKSLKSRGGLTHGSGMSESVRLTWIKTVHICANLHDALCHLGGLVNQTREEHSEFGKSRSRRDGNDSRKISDWFELHDPFKTNDSELRSISAGLTSSVGNGINCDMAEEIGAKIQMKLDDKCFSDVVLKKSDKVKTLTRLQKVLVVDKKEIFVQSAHLFNRLIVLVEWTTEMEQYFSYELTPMPSSLFQDSFMRKPQKAALGPVLFQKAMFTESLPASQFVLDGGSLLHKIKWPKTGKYIDVIKLYLGYILRNYGSKCCIVFDGYESGPTTKDHEHERRSKTSSCAPNIEVGEQRSVYTKQSAFLANGHNKTQLIVFLSQHLIEDNHEVIQSANDADTEIVKVAIALAKTGKVVTVVAEDTDVLVLLVHHFEATMGNLYMLSSVGL